MTGPLLQPPPPADLGARVVDVLDALVARCPFDPAAMEAGCRRVEELSRRHLLRAFQAEGVFLEAGEQHRAVQLEQQLRVVPAYSRLFTFLLDMLTHDGVAVSPD